MRKFILGWTLVGTALTGCQQHDNSSVDSLDNLVRPSQGIQVNVCRGNYTRTVAPWDMEVEPSLVEDGNTNLSDAVYLALSAVPPAIRQNFNRGGRSRIRLHADIAAACPEDSMTIADQVWASEGGALQSCWGTEADSIIIEIEGDPQVVGHQLLRMYARNLAESIRMAPLAMDQQTQAKHPELVREMSQFGGWLQDLRETFLGELRADSKGSLPEALASLAGTDRSWELDSFIFADAFDSYYCNSSTQASFSQRFADTFALFQSWATAIEQESEQLTTSASSELTPESGPTSSGGFLLQEPLWQNIPIIGDFGRFADRGFANAERRGQATPGVSPFSGNPRYSDIQY